MNEAQNTIPEPSVLRDMQTENDIGKPTETDSSKQMPTEPRSIEESQRIIEAILYAAGYPVSYEKLAEVLETTPGAVKKMVSAYQKVYNDPTAVRGVELLMFDTACQLCTKALYEEKIKKVLGMRRGGGLSNASLEVLAIVAYRQPVTRLYIEQIRGVDSSYHVGSLVDKGLIESKGRLDVPGRPVLYGTTKDFLRCFGISSLSELPSVDLFGMQDGQQISFDEVDQMDGAENHTAENTIENPRITVPENAEVSALNQTEKTAFEQNV